MRSNAAQGTWDGHRPKTLTSDAIQLFMKSMRKGYALILDRSHRALVPEPSGYGSLVQLKERMAAVGIQFPPPVGLEPPNFAFLLPDVVPAPKGYEWVKLSDL